MVWRGESSQVEDHDTKFRYSDTDHNTKRVPQMKKQKDIVNFCSVRLQALVSKVASSGSKVASSSSKVASSGSKVASSSL